jgi:hypothetical protein
VNHRPRIYRYLLAASLIVIVGCGSGGGTQLAGLTGVVTDGEGRAVVGATVTSGTQTTQSLTNGTFVLSSVQEGFRLVQASTTISGAKWTGETMVDVVGSEQNRSTNIIVSAENTQGQIQGSVIDPQGFGVPGAKVFFAGPLGSTLAVADDNGNYTARRIPGGFTYQVTASFAGLVNQTLSVHVTAKQTASASFALGSGNSQGAIPAPTNVAAQAWTVADTVTRATESGTPQGLYDWLKHVYRQKRGLPDKPQAKNVRLTKTSRLWPTASVVEIDLFWDFQSFNDLFGYAIKRGTNQSPLDVTAIVRDPLTSVFFDVDPLLTPDVTYKYTVHRLDTIDFPANGTIGPASSIVTATPLNRLLTTAPAQSAQTNATPVFQWQAVNGAKGYQIYVWDKFPALLFDPNNPNEPAAVQPVWPQNLNSPGSSFVTSGTSVTYQGPALQSGHTYYWMVVAVDSTNQNSIGALSGSPLRHFTVH